MYIYRHTQARISHIPTHLWFNCDQPHSYTLIYTRLWLNVPLDACLQPLCQADLRQVIDHHNAGGMKCMHRNNMPRYLSSATHQLQLYRAPRYLTSSETCTVQCPRGKLLGCHSNNTPTIHFVGFLHQVTQEKTHQC